MFDPESAQLAAEPQSQCCESLTRSFEACRVRLVKCLLSALAAIAIVHETKQLLHVCSLHSIIVQNRVSDTSIFDMRILWVTQQSLK
jgi:hypothetical protein